MKQLREERGFRGKPLGAEEEFNATLFRAVREQLHVHKLGVPPEVAVSSFRLPGTLVLVSAIYDKFQEPGCTCKPTRGALWAGDVFRPCSDGGFRVRYRIASTFASAQASWEGTLWIRI
jgi:hypothetical protein